jgi:hypothetical protein
MKLTLNIAAALILILSIYAEPSKISNNTSKVAILEFDTEVIDYGKVEQHSDGNRVFTFTNKGDAPLIIADVKTSCGCTVPSYTKTPILPGETGSLNIKYDTRKLGAFSKRITVISNADGGQKFLKIKGNIIAPK